LDENYNFCIKNRDSQKNSGFVDGSIPFNTYGTFEMRGYPQQQATGGARTTVDQHAGFRNLGHPKNHPYKYRIFNYKPSSYWGFPTFEETPTMFSDELWDRATDDKMPNNSARWGIESHEIPWDEHPCGGCHKWGIPQKWMVYIR